jgi:hypothetical protein
MSTGNTGRIGENIAMNHLLENGFRVIHLDKGMTGVSANADLLVAHEKLNRFVAIQVKSTRIKPHQTLNYVGLGSPAQTGQHYNRKGGVQAEFLAYVAYRFEEANGGLRVAEHRVFFAPLLVAEGIMGEAHGVKMGKPLRSGVQPKHPAMGLWMFFDDLLKRGATEECGILLD